MNKVDELLEYVQKTNAEMTREKLLEELGRNPASTICLLMEFYTSGERPEFRSYPTA